MNTRRLGMGALGIGATLAVAGGIWRRFRRQSVAGKVVVIVGGSRGLGLDVARILVDRGAYVALCARPSAALEQTADELGPEAFVAACDASQEAEVGSFIRQVVERFGKIDVLVTVAANIEVGPVEQMRKADFQRAFEQTFWTAFHPTMAVLPQLRSQPVVDGRRGQVVHVTSFGGKLAVPHLLPYCTAKFAATGFSEGLRAELSKDHILVTTITPSLMRTGSQEHVPFKGQREKEYRWFAAGAVAPLVGLRAERAAALLVDAIETGDADPTFSPLVKIATIFKAVAPGLTSTLLGWMNRSLPDPVPGDFQSELGADLAKKSADPIVQAIESATEKNSAQHHGYRH